MTHQENWGNRWRRTYYEYLELINKPAKFFDKRRIILTAQYRCNNYFLNTKITAIWTTTFLTEVMRLYLKMSHAATRGRILQGWSRIHPIRVRVRVQVLTIRVRVRVNQTLVPSPSPSPCSRVRVLKSQLNNLICHSMLNACLWLELFLSNILSAWKDLLDLQFLSSNFTVLILKQYYTIYSQCALYAHFIW